MSTSSSYRPVAVRWEVAIVGGITGGVMLLFILVVMGVL